MVISWPEFYADLKVRYILSDYFSLRTRLWTKIQTDGLIFDAYQDELKNFGKFKIFTKSRNNVWVSPLSNWKEFSLFWVVVWNALSELLHPRPPNFGHFWADFESFRAFWAIQKVNRHKRNVMGISSRGVHFEKLRLLICEILHLAKMHQNMYISQEYLE